MHSPDLSPLPAEEAPFVQEECGDTMWDAVLAQPDSITAIFNQPTTDPVDLEPDNLAGDQPADLSMQGGPAKAVYAYTTAH